MKKILLNRGFGVIFIFLLTIFVGITSYNLSFGAISENAEGGGGDVCNHDWGNWQYSNLNKKHYKICRECNEKEETGDHTYGDAWFYSSSNGHYQKCSLCFVNGNKQSSHITQSEWQTDKNNPDVHYKNCIAANCSYKETKGHFFDGVGFCKVQDCKAILSVDTSPFNSLLAQLQYRCADNGCNEPSLGSVTLTTSYPPVDEAGNALPLSVSYSGYSHGTFDAHAERYLNNTGMEFPTGNASAYYSAWGGSRASAWLGLSSGTKTGSYNGTSGYVVDFSDLTGHYEINSVSLNNALAASVNRLFRNGGPSIVSGSKKVVTVKHINDSTGAELVAPQEIKLKKGESAGTFNALSETDLKLYGSNIKYINKMEKITSGGTETKAEASITLNDVTENITIIFHYLQYGQVKILEVIDNYPTYTVIKSDSIDNVSINKGGTKKTSEATSYSNYKYVGHKVIQKAVYETSELVNGKNNNKKAEAVLTVENPIQTIIFFYKLDGISFEVEHWDITNNSRMVSDGSEITNPYGSNLGDLFASCIDIGKAENKEHLDFYINTMNNNSYSTGEKASKILEKISELTPTTNAGLSVLKSLNLEKEVYKEYVNKRLDVEGVEVVTDNMQARDRYINLNGLSNKLGTLAVSDNTVNIRYNYQKGIVNIIHKVIEVDEAGNKIVIKEVKDSEIIGTGIDVSSWDLNETDENGLLHYNSYLNGAEQYISGKYKKEEYKIRVNPLTNGGNQEVIFEYIRVKVIVKDTYIGGEKAGTTTRLTENLDSEKVYQSKELTGTEYYNSRVVINEDVMKVGESGSVITSLKGLYSVSVKPSTEEPKNQIIEFVYIYTKYDGEDKGEYPELNYTPVVCYPIIKDESNDNVVEINGQKVAQVGSDITINIPNNGIHELVDPGVDDYYNTEFAKQKLVKFPFDVYFENNLYSAGKWIEVARGANVGNTGFTFSIPAWVDDNKEYEIEVWVTSTELMGHGTESMISARTNDKYNDIFNEGNVASNDVKIMWQTSLFGGAKAGKEYKTSELPIGQAGGVSSAYKYGIKLGSTFLFSVNTLGINNSSIKLEPKVYFVSKDGTVKGDVTEELQYKTEKGLVSFKNDTSIELATKINKTTRVTMQVRQEISKSSAMRSSGFTDYGQNTNADVSYGYYNKLTINKSLRLPYYEYMNEIDSKWRTNENKVLTGASHWYGEYRLPATTKYSEEEGFYIVCFKITSLDSAGNEYLKYHDQLIAGNQWKVEKWNDGKSNNTEVEIKLPLIIGQTAAKNVKLNISNDYYPVAIYQSNISINNNYEVGGTH